MRSSHFVDHSEASGSAVLLIQDASPLVTKCQFRNNSYSHWLVVTLEKSAAVFAHCVFESNIASSDVPSGALQLDGSGNGTVHACTFKNNRAAAAAGLLVGVRVFAQISASLFEANNASMSGDATVMNGALMCESPAHHIHQRTHC